MKKHCHCSPARTLIVRYAFFNTSFIWCAMHEMGGNVGLFGDATTVATQPLAARDATAALVGHGIDPEGINQNPAYYQVVLDNAWRADPVNASAWLAGDWSTQRCGRASDLAQDAWSLLARTVYSDSSKQHYEHHMKCGHDANCDGATRAFARSDSGLGDCRQWCHR